MAIPLAPQPVSDLDRTATQVPPKPLNQSILGQVQAGGGVSLAPPGSMTAGTITAENLKPPAPAPQPQIPLGKVPAGTPLRQQDLNGQIAARGTAQMPVPPSQMAPPSIPLATQSAPQGMVSTPTAQAGPAYTTPTITPGGEGDLLNKTITPGAGVDRLALAKSNFQNFKDSTEPEYEATLRKAGQSGAAAGQVGSGMLRGTLGDIGLSRTRDLQGAENSFLNNATQGSIADNYNNIGIAQQQQGFQQGQQGTAFNQADEQARLGNDLTNSAFGRSAATLNAGDAGNPSDVGLALSGYYGNQAGQAGQAAGSLVGNSVLANALKKNPPQYPAGATY